MKRLQLDEDIQPLSEFRANIGAYIEKVKKTKRPLVITLHGKSAAVMMDVTEYEGLIEKLELLSDIQTAETQLSQGKGVLHKDAKQQVLERLK